jgi:hypothetical protein
MAQPNLGWRPPGTVQDITVRHQADMLLRRHAFIANAITDPVSVSGAHTRSARHHPAAF